MHRLTTEVAASSTILILFAIFILPVPLILQILWAQRRIAPFLPRQKRELSEKLLAIARTGMPIAVAHESPHRVIDLVSVICETLPGCRVSASCDLTKLHEKTIRGTAEEVLAMLRANEKAEKGEYCLVLDLHDVHVAEKKTASDASLEARIFEQLMAGRDMREAGDALMEQGEKRNDVYRARTAVQKFLEELLEEDDDE